MKNYTNKIQNKKTNKNYNNQNSENKKQSTKESALVEITVDKLKFLNRKNLDCDLMKIIWNPAIVDVLNEDKHFMDYMNKAERAKIVLCRIDDVAAVTAGNSLGINLYQGRYVQRLLNSMTKRG